MSLRPSFILPKEYLRYLIKSSHISVLNCHVGRPLRLNKNLSVYGTDFSFKMLQDLEWVVAYVCVDKGQQLDKT